MPQHCLAILMTGTRWALSFRRCKRSSATSSIAVSPMDALDLWRVQGIDFAAALAALLLQHAPGQEQRPYERLPQLFIPDDAPLDVADDTAEIGLELA